MEEGKDIFSVTTSSLPQSKHWFYCLVGMFFGYVSRIPFWGETIPVMFYNNLSLSSGWVELDPLCGRLNIDPLRHSRCNLCNL